MSGGLTPLSHVRLVFAWLVLTGLSSGCDPDYVKTQRYGNGQLSRAEEYRIEADGKHVLHGRSLAWYESGARAMEGTYVNGRMHGIWVFYYENGRKKQLWHLRRGKFIGTGVQWY